MTAAVACSECGSPVFAEDRFCGTCGAVQSASVGGLGTSTERAAKLLAELRALTAGEYEVRGEIGRGGMAVVYLAYDLRLNRKVAIKAMLPDLAFHDGMEERFKREARTAARLDHPNIVVIHSVRDSGDPLFFVMKFVDGAPLDAVVKTHGPLPIHAVQGLLIQLCSALQYAHENGVVHRDVKPANILLDAHGAVQVTDFGIAKAADSAHLTRTGLAIGTPTYMCPEQCMGHAQTNA
ncbi:MAG TPA: serine/threonine-protein kinase, partial [Gemmatimonadaceae bacterium]|nr:serine/threonine-protein kinase [Gemmatimonadaceae bacterium]